MGEWRPPLPDAGRWPVTALSVARRAVEGVDWPRTLAAAVTVRAVRGGSWLGLAFLVVAAVAPGWW